MEANYEVVTYIFTQNVNTIFVDNVKVSNKVVNYVSNLDLKDENTIGVWRIKKKS